MTALCGGGTSAAKPGASLVTLLASGFLAVALQRYGAGWMQWALPFLSLPELTLSSFCNTDPPAIPTFTAAESKAIVDLTLGADFDSGLSKFGDLVKHLVWYDLCQCTSGALTALPAAPAPPAGTPIYTPTPVATAGACDSVPWHAVTSFVGPSTGLLTTQPVQYVVVKYTNTITLAPGQTIQLNLNFFYSPAGGPGPGSLLLMKQYLIAPGETNTQVVACPVGTNFVRPDFTVSGGAGTSGMSYSIDGYCTSAPPGASASPCCPPDPNTQLQLDAILRMVTLLQRQLVPFAYISSTPHAGLTGTGTIAVQGLLGVRIDLTTMPGSLTQDASVPPFVYNVGWVSIEDANGFIDETRAHAQHQVWFSRIASDATLVGYSFAPGIVATITELQREP